MADWTNKQVAFFAARWAAGDSYRDVGNAMAEQGWPARDDAALATKRANLKLPPRFIKRAEADRPAKRERHLIWTPERIATLRRMHAERASFSTIAKAIGDGITRNAVIGKARRIGLPNLSEEEKRRRVQVAVLKRLPPAPKATQPELTPVAVRYVPPPEPVLIQPAPRKPRITDPTALAVAALLSQCANAERRRSQYRAQPNGALRAR